MAYADDWERPLSSGRDGLALMQVATGIAHGNWQFSWAFQRQYVVQPSRDAVRLYHAERNDTPLPTDTGYSLDLDLNFYEVRGLRIGRTFREIQAAGLSLSLTPIVGLWDGQGFEDGHLRGSATTDAAGELQYAARLSHHYTEDYFLERPVDAPQGIGASLDLQAHWEAGNWSGEASFHNLLGRIWWQDAPRTTGQLSSATRQTQPDGSVEFAPTLTGVEDGSSHRQRMALFASGSAMRAFGAHRLGARLVHTEIGTYAGLSADSRRGALRFGASWYPGLRDAVELKLSWPWIELAFGSNRWRWDDAEQLRIQLALRVPLAR